MEAPRSLLRCCLQGSKGLTIQYANNTLKGNSGMAGPARSSPARLPTPLLPPHVRRPFPGVRGVRRGHGHGRVLRAEAGCGLRAPGWPAAAQAHSGAASVCLSRDPTALTSGVWGRWPRTPGLYVRRAAAPAALSD